MFLRRHFQAVTVPSDGTYKITIAGISDQSKDGTVSLYKNDTNSEALVSVDTKWAYNNPITATTAENVELKAGDKLIGYTDSWNGGLDYILLEKVEPEVEYVSKGFTFDAALESLSDKTLTVTIDGETKSLSMSGLIGTATTGTGDALLGLIITGIPNTVTSVSAVIE